MLQFFVGILLPAPCWLKVFLLVRCYVVYHSNFVRILTEKWEAQAWLQVRGQFLCAMYWKGYSSKLFLECEYASFYLEPGGFVEWLIGNLVGRGKARIVHVVVRVLNFIEFIKCNICRIMSHLKNNQK